MNSVGLETISLLIRRALRFLECEGTEVAGCIDVGLGAGGGLLGIVSYLGPAMRSGSSPVGQKNRDADGVEGIKARRS